VISFTNRSDSTEMASCENYKIINYDYNSLITNNVYYKPGYTMTSIKLVIKLLKHYLICNLHLLFTVKVCTQGSTSPWLAKRISIVIVVAVNVVATWCHIENKWTHYYWYCCRPVSKPNRQQRNESSNHDYLTLQQKKTFIADHDFSQGLSCVCLGV